MSLLVWVFVFAGMVLQGLVLSAMLKGSFRRYPFIFSYLIAGFLSTVVQFSLRHNYGPRSREFVAFYWASDFLATFLILMIIIHLIRVAMEKHKYRNAVYRGLLLGAVATAAVSVVLMHNRSWDLLFRKLMTEIGRDYYFSAVILNAVLWCTLVRSNHENKELYLLTSGLGLQLTGAAIAHALRITGHFLAVANCILLVTYLLNLYIWYITFKRFRVEVRVGAEQSEKTCATRPGVGVKL